jgi:hypothetical protein
MKNRLCGALLRGGEAMPRSVDVRRIYLRLVVPRASPEAAWTGAAAWHRPGRLGAYDRTVATDPARAPHPVSAAPPVDTQCLALAP